MEKVGIIGGLRTPFCRAMGSYSRLSGLEMLTAVLRGLTEKFSLGKKHIDEVVAGSVMAHSEDWNLAREAVLESGLAPTTPGITVQQACGTSLQAALMVAAKIQSGQIQCGIAAGSDSVSDPPVVFGRRFARRLAAMAKARGLWSKLRLLKGFCSDGVIAQASLGRRASHLLDHGGALRANGKKVENKQKRAGRAGPRQPP